VGYTAWSGLSGNTLPVAVDDSADTYENMPVTIDVLTNDRDEDVGALTVRTCERA
jgi:hypothetical protein